LDGLKTDKSERRRNGPRDLGVNAKDYNL
jgi:hypothetical protein